MAHLGADVQELEALAHRFLAASRRLRSLAGRIDGPVNSVTWWGRDADHFRQRWNDGHKVRIRQMADHLERLAADALRAAAQQRMTSQGGW